MGQDTHHKQSRVRSTSTELGQERAGTSVPGHAGAQGTRAAPHGAGWSPGVGRRLSKSRRVARHQTGCCLLLLFAWKQHRTLLPTRTTQRGPSGTKGQRPTWLPCPASLSGCGVDGAEENPSQDIDFNFLRIKKKKPNQTDKNFLKTASYLIISQKLAWKHHLPVPAPGSACPPQPSSPGMGSASFRALPPTHSVSRVQGTPRPPLPSVGPGRGAGGFGQPQWVLSHPHPPKLSSSA